jgi:hybrid cluster-associated redox disulfide protein
MDNPLPSLELTAAEVLSRWPATISVFLQYKTGCVGCDMAPFDTLADVIRIYKLPGETFLQAIHIAVHSAAIGGETQE